MQRILWYAVLAFVALGAPISGQRPAQQPQMPRANVRELTTINGWADAWVLLPSGRTLIYASDESPSGVSAAEASTFTLDIAAKRRTLLGTNMVPVSVSPLGDRLAFIRFSENRTDALLWTMPIDPKTGTATGQAQRVSLRPTRLGATFSRDGKMLAFRGTEPRPDGTQDLVLVPATGGAERIVGSYARGRMAWSADGKSLYLRSNDPKTVIERVAVEGGRSELLFTRTAVTNRNVVGLSPDARVAFFQANPDRFFYQTASGVEGEISVALPPPIGGGEGFDLTLDSMSRYITTTRTRNQGVRVLDVTTGEARDVLPRNVHSSAPAWSADGRRLAVLTGSLFHRDIIVMNADGSGQRRYPLPLHVSAVNSPMARPWSPDGRFLAFIVDDGRKVAPGPAPLLHQIALLDLKSGQTRVLKTSPGDLFYVVWRADAGAIRTVKRTIGPDGSQSRWSIVEIPLNGAERSLRDITAEFPTVSSVTLPSDQNAVVRAGTGQRPEWYLVPLNGGAARRLAVTTESGTRIGDGLPAGNELLFAQFDGANGDFQGLTIVSTVGDATRTLRFPFSGFGGMVFPDGKRIVAVAKPTGDDSEYRLFLVPLDGSPSRQLGEIPRGDGGLLAPSPDGKLIAYTSVNGFMTTKILEINFAPALQSIVKR